MARSLPAHMHDQFPNCNRLYVCLQYSYQLRMQAVDPHRLPDAMPTTALNLAMGDSIEQALMSELELRESRGWA